MNPLGTSVSKEPTGWHAYNLHHGTRWRTSESQYISRKNWKIIWKANIPNKVSFFLGWRATCDNLANNRNKMRRTLEIDR
jgi:hypothetical protein